MSTARHFEERTTAAEPFDYLISLWGRFFALFVPILL